MIKLFRKIRQRLLPENKFNKYLIYAFGEIILVVIGILIALQINNWNQQRIQNNELSKIHQRIILDIENDIQELYSHLIFWKEKEPLFKKVVNDSMSADLFDLGLSRLLTTIPRTSLNKTGVQQLKTLNVKDQLSLRIIEIYDYMENISIRPFEKKMIQESNDLISIFQDKYEWFPEWMSKTIMKDNSSKELQDYFLTSMEYRNRVINANQRILNNYVGSLEYCIPILERIRSDLKMITEDTFLEISEKDLKQYEGTYKLIKFEEEHFDWELDALYKVTAHDIFLRIVDLKYPEYIYVFYHSGNRSFYYDFNEVKITVNFEANSSHQIDGFKLEMEFNQTKGAFYAFKQEIEIKNE